MARERRLARRILLIASCGVLTAGSVLANADTTATWSTETSGDWTNATLWSTSPDYPNNGSPAGINYQAVVSAVGGTAYTATLDSDVTVDGITVDSADAEIDQTSGTLQAGTINVNNGAYQMDGGTIANTTLDISNGSFNVTTGVFDNVTVADGTLSVGSAGGLSGATLTVQDGLTTTGSGTIVMNPVRAGLTVLFDGPSQSIDSITVLGLADSGKGSIDISGPDSTSPTTLTLGAHSSLSGTLAIADGTQTGGTLINNGTIDAGANASSPSTAQDYSLDIDVTNFTNHGIVQANSRGLLSLNSAHWINLGQFTASDGSMLALGGSFTPAQMGVISLDSTSAVAISGTLDNTNNTLAMPSTGFFLLDGGSIIGGTLDASAGTPTVIQGTLDNVHIADGDLNFTNQNPATGGFTDGDLVVEGNLTLDAGHQINMTCGGDIQLAFDGGSRTVDNLAIEATPNAAVSYPGHGEIAVGGPHTTGPVTLTLGANFLLHGFVSVVDGSTSGCTLINNGTISSDYNPAPVFGTGSSGGATNSSLITVDSFINNGTVQAIDGATLTINSPTWTNAGTISATAAGCVILGGAFTNTGTVSTDSTGSVEITGTLTNTGASFPTPSAGTLSLNGGTIIGGTINESSGNPLLIFSSSTLNGVQVSNGDVNVNGELTVQNGLTLDSGRTLTLEAGSGISGSSYEFYSSSLNVDVPTFTIPNFIIAGQQRGFGETNTINIGGPDSGPASTLVVGSDATLKGDLQINNAIIYPQGNPLSLPNNGIPIQGTLINNGTINSAGSSLTINVTTFTNNGTVEADSGNVTINSPNFTNNGTITAVNGSPGSFPPIGGSINIQTNLTTAALGRFNLDATSSLVIAGTLDNTGSTLVLPPSGIVNLAGTITGGTVDETTGNTLYTSGISTLDGVYIEGGNVIEGVPVIFTIASYNTINIDHGLVLDPGFQVVLSASTGPSLVFDGADQTVSQLAIDGTGNEAFFLGLSTYPTSIDVGGPNSINSPTLTLGPDAIIHGALNINDGQNASQTFNSTLVNNGTIDADQGGGSLIVSVANFLNYGALKATNGGTLQITSPNFVNHGAVAMNGGTLSIIQPGSNNTAGTFDVGDGSLTGSGTIDCNLTLDSDPSTLAFQLRSETDYDVLDVAGDVTIAGNLLVTLANGFEPAYGDVFTVLTVDPSDWMTGAFLDVPDGERLETVDGSGSFLVNYGSGNDANDIVLSDFEPANVPEPIAATTMGAASIGLMARRRKTATVRSTAFL
ncbi:MAG: hypothetical protein ABSB74_19650 [Tepidisphaeraceae bacterium]